MTSIVGEVMDYFANTWPFFILYGGATAALLIVMMSRREEYSDNVLPYVSLSFLATLFVHTIFYQQYLMSLLGILTVILVVWFYRIQVRTETNMMFAWIVVSGGFLLATHVWSTSRWIEVAAAAFATVVAIRGKRLLEGSAYFTKQ